MIRVVEGFLALSRRVRSANEVPEVLVHQTAIAAIEPHRTGCYVYVAGNKFDVEHSQTEIAQAVTAEIHRS